VFLGKRSTLSSISIFNWRNESVWGNYSKCTPPAYVNILVQSFAVYVSWERRILRLEGHGGWGEGAAQGLTPALYERTLGAQCGTARRAAATAAVGLDVHRAWPHYLT
jgi:hypothetical protein